MISDEVWLCISERDRRLLEDCFLYVNANESLPSMFKYLWGRLNREQKLLIEFMFYRLGYQLGSQGLLVL